MGGNGSGKKAMSMDMRKGCVGISMAPAEFDMIMALPIIGGVSAKVMTIIHEWMAIKEILVQYRTDEQREQGTPVILNRFADRAFSSSQWGTGYHFERNKYATQYKDIVKRVVARLGTQGKTPKWFQANIMPELIKEGFIVQCIDEPEWDLFDAWICPAASSTTGDNCSRCPIVNNILGYVTKIKEAKGIVFHDEVVGNSSSGTV
jgi:hypothetical protein